MNKDIIYVALGIVLIWVLLAHLPQLVFLGIVYLVYRWIHRIIIGPPKPSIGHDHHPVP